MTDILAERHDGVLRLVLNRPDKLNPLSPSMLDTLWGHITGAATDRAVRAVVLTGTGRAFSSGADLRAGLSQGADLGRALETHYNPLVLAMRALPKPIIAGINGICAGAACNLALACDILVAARSASFSQIFARIGLLPDAGGTYFLPRIIGSQRAMAAAMLADQIGAEQALQWGMVWQVVDDQELDASVNALAQRLAQGPTAAYAAIKRAMGLGAAGDLATQLQLEADLQRELGQSADFAEGVGAFLQKRPAKFTGT
jgi:2-(1,2-epoxy-1,2-dihydrophenyl)acetyl-CoA isomerase